MVEAGTAKGRRSCHVLVRTAARRRLLDEARRPAGGGALIPAGRDPGEQRRAYEDQTRAGGPGRSHGLRHAYAPDRQEGLTGWKASAAGGPARSELTDGERRIDAAARLRISRELGRGRLEIVRRYCG